jgi:dihydroorotate dehydrogenase electron transfer subunit
MNKKEVREFIVVENKRLNKTNSLIRIKSQAELPKIRPGQFMNIEIGNCKEIFLRRPFSVFEVDYANNLISIIVKVLGRGSAALAEIGINEKLSVIFPLGKEFTMPDKKDNVLLIGGGSGTAPMLFLAKESGLTPENVHILLGARSENDHIDVTDYQKYGIIHYSTDDGSLGEKGFVTQHSVFQNNLKSFDRIYACGPDAMMKAVAKSAKEEGIFCEVSLENLMACGFGVCLCCIEPTTRGNLCVCTEGPVFNVNELKWQI